MTGQETVASVVDKLNIMVFEERRTITFKWLSRMLSLPSDVAKQLLFTFSTSCPPDQLDVVFFLSGWTKAPEPRHIIMLVAGKDLPEAKAALDPVCCLHVYSVRPAAPITAVTEGSEGANGDVDMDGATEAKGRDTSSGTAPSAASNTSALAHTLSLVVAEDLAERLQLFNKLAGDGPVGPMWDNRFSSIACSEVKRGTAGRQGGGCQTAPAMSPAVASASGRMSAAATPGSKVDTTPTHPSKQTMHTEAKKAAVDAAVTGGGGGAAAGVAAAKPGEVVAAGKEGGKAPPASNAAANKGGKAGAAKATVAPAANKKGGIASMWASAAPKAKPAVAAPASRAAAPSSAEALIRAQEAAENDEDDEDEDFVRPAQRKGGGTNGANARKNRHVLMDEDEEEEEEEEEGDEEEEKAEPLPAQDPPCEARGRAAEGASVAGAGGQQPAEGGASQEETGMDVDAHVPDAPRPDASMEPSSQKVVTEMEAEGASQKTGGGTESQGEVASDSLPLAQVSQEDSQEGERAVQEPAPHELSPGPAAAKKRKVVMETYIDDKGNEVTRVVTEGGPPSPEKVGALSRAAPAAPVKASAPAVLNEDPAKKVTPKAAEPRKAPTAVTPKQPPAKKAAPPAKPGPKQGSITSFFSKKPA